MLFSAPIIETVADFLEAEPGSARRRSGHGRGLGREASPGRRGRSARGPALSARDGRDAEPARGLRARRRSVRARTPTARALAEAIARRSARRRSSSRAGTATRPWTGSSTASATSPIPVERYADEATHGAGARTRRAWPRSSRAGRASRRRPRGGRGRGRGGPARPHRDRRRLGPRRRLRPCGFRSSVSSGSSRSSSGAGSSAASATTGRSSTDGVVVTQDTLVEGVHFRLEWTSWRDLGYKAAAVNLSDLAALGAEPEALFVALAHPRRDGGRTTSSSSTRAWTSPACPSAAATPRRATALYLARDRRRPERARTRPSAVPGRATCSSSPGRWAARRPVSRRSSAASTGFDELVGRTAGRRSASTQAAGSRRVAHALIDLSDGIASDAARIAEQSGCRLVIDVERLPLAPRLEEVGDEPFWTMGEDYELLAALAPEDADASASRRRVAASREAAELLLDGRRRADARPL